MKVLVHLENWLYRKLMARAVKRQSVPITAMRFSNPVVNPNPLTPPNHTGLSECNKCGRTYKSAPPGYIHKCGYCRGGRCHPVVDDPDTKSKCVNCGAEYDWVFKDRTHRCSFCDNGVCHPYRNGTFFIRTDSKISDTPSVDGGAVDGG